MNNFSSPFMAKNPLNRRDQSKKEKRLSNKLETTKKESADHYFGNTGDKNYQKKQDKYERKELKTKQKLNKEQRKQSRKSFGLDKDPDKKEIKKYNKKERKNLKAKQKKYNEIRKERNK